MASSNHNEDPDEILDNNSDDERESEARGPVLPNADLYPNVNVINRENRSRRRSVASVYLDTLEQTGDPSDHRRISNRPNNNVQSGENTREIERLHAEHREIARRRQSANLDATYRAALRDGEDAQQLLDELLDEIAVRENRPNVPCYVMPDLSKNVEDFSNDDNGPRARDWLENLDLLISVHQWSENQALQTARAHLVRGAKDWFVPRASILITWTKFRQAFKRTFLITESTVDKWQKMCTGSQREGESLSNYFFAKTRLCLELNLSIGETKEQVLRGLASSELRVSILTKQYYDHDTLLEDLMTNERCLKSIDHNQRYKSSSKTERRRNETVPRTATNPTRTTPYKRGYQTGFKDTTTGSNSTKDTTGSKITKDTTTRLPIRNEERQFKCFNCNNYGHIAHDCPEPKRILKCRNCGKEGHTQKHCKSEQKPRATMNVIEVNNNNSVSKYVKTVKINDRSITALIDPGSSDCTIKSTRVLNERFKIIHAETELKGFGPAHHPVTSPGIVKADISIDDVMVPNILIRIVPDDTQHYDAIIGRTFTEAAWVEYRKYENKLEFTRREGMEGLITEIDNPITNTVTINDCVIPPATIQFINVANKNREHAVAVMNYNENNETVNKNTTMFKCAVEPLPIIKHNANRELITRDHLQIGDEQPETVVHELITLINNYRDCVALNINEIGLAKNCVMDIVEIPGSLPTAKQPYRASEKEREEMRRIIHEWEEAGIVQDTESPYASPVLLVEKKNGKCRLVADFRKLNAQTERVNFPLSNLDDHLAKIGDSSVFITLDLAHGYLQIPLTENAIPKTAIITPDDTVEFTRMMFGLMNGPAYFSKTMQKALGPLRDNIVMYYLDGIFIPGKDWQDLKTRLELTLQALRNAGLTLNLEKSTFLQNRVSYLGFEISEKGIEPGETKTRAILDLPEPKNVHEVRRFLGMASFFRRFIPRFAHMAAPLHKLLRKDVAFIWSADEQTAFVNLKAALANKPVLQPFNYSRKTELHTDASAAGLAAMLMQRDDDNKLRVVYAISRRTSEPEKNYHSSKLELLAIIWAVMRLRPLIANIAFTIVTDCQALLYLNTSKTINPQVIRWNDLLSEFTFQLVHKPGEKMQHVDALSRAPVDGEQNEHVEIQHGVFTIINECDEVAMQQLNDSVIKRKRELLEKETEQLTGSELSEVKDYVIHDGLVYKVIGNKRLFVVPSAMRKSLTVRYHDLKGHTGLERSTNMLLDRYYFPSVKRYMRNHIRACMQCALTKTKPGPQGGELHPIPPGERPFALTHIDHTGPFVTSGKGYKYILVIVDNLTKYIQLHPTKDTKVAPVIRALNKSVKKFGAPYRIVSDRGTCFTSTNFKDWCDLQGIKHTLNSPRHPQANGQVERMNATLMPVLMASLADNEGKNWDAKLDEVEQQLNDAPNATTGKSPFELLYGYTAQRGEGLLRTRTGDARVYTNPSELQQQARKLIEDKQNQMKNRYDAGRAKNIFYEVGDLVYLRAIPVSTGESTKFQTKYKGPLVITQKLKGDTYKIAALREKNGRRYASTAHVTQLKQWKPHEDDNEDNSDTEEEAETHEENHVNDDPENHENLERVNEEPENNENDVPEQQENSRKDNEVENRRSRRERRTPNYLNDYITSDALEDECN